jgi:hypothetical protein
MREKRIRKQFRFNGYGFPIILQDVPMIKLRGEWTPDIDWNLLEDVMALLVALKPARLSGNEAKFLRLHFALSLEKFAALFDNSKQAAIKWEKTGDAATHMAWTTEKDLRLYTLARHDVPSALFRRAYDALKKKRDELDPLYKLPMEMIEEDQDKLVESFLGC